jgi:hypothetical protein
MTRHLPRRVDLNLLVPRFPAYGIEHPDAVEADDVFEVPADQKIHSADGGDGDVKGVRNEALRNDAVFQVRAGYRLSL